MQGYHCLMIYRQSTDPVFLKKINIDVWLLRDQLEQIILSKLDENPEVTNFDHLIEEFAPKEKPNLRLLKFEEQNEENDKSEETSDTDAIKNDSEEDDTSPQKKEIITQRIPKLSSEKICQGRTFLSEIYMDKILFFSDRQFIEGQSIVIKFDVHEPFILNAEILYSQSYSLKNRIISDSNLPYRVYAQFTFLREGERTLLRKFLENIEYRPKGLELVEDEESEEKPGEVRENQEIEEEEQTVDEEQNKESSSSE